MLKFGLRLVLIWLYKEGFYQKFFRKFRAKDFLSPLLTFENCGKRNNSQKFVSAFIKESPISKFI
jgi:hypothetical protein